MIKSELNYIKDYLSNCLKRLGYSIAAENVLEIDDIELIILYVNQVRANYHNWHISQIKLFNTVTSRLRSSTPR